MIELSFYKRRTANTAALVTPLLNYTMYNRNKTYRWEKVSPYKQQKDRPHIKDNYQSNEKQC